MLNYIEPFLRVAIALLVFCFQHAAQRSGTLETARPPEQLAANQPSLNSSTLHSMLFFFIIEPLSGSSLATNSF